MYSVIGSSKGQHLNHAFNGSPRHIITYQYDLNLMSNISSFHNMPPLDILHILLWYTRDCFGSSSSFVRLHKIWGGGVFVEPFVSLSIPANCWQPSTPLTQEPFRSCLNCPNCSVPSNSQNRCVEVIKAKWKVQKALNCNKGAVQSVPKCTVTVPQYPPTATQLDMQSLFWRVEVDTVLTSSSSGSRPEWLPDCQWPAGPHSTLHRFSICSTEIYCNILATHTTLYKFPVVSERTEIYWRHILATLHYTRHFKLHKFPIVVICNIALW